MKNLGMTGSLFFLLGFFLPLTFYPQMNIYLNYLEYEFMFGKTVLGLWFFATYFILVDQPHLSMVLSLLASMVIANDTWIFFRSQALIIPSKGLFLLDLGVVLIFASSLILMINGAPPPQAQTGESHQPEGENKGQGPEIPGERK